jgi:hypothetical protein
MKIAIFLTFMGAFVAFIAMTVLQSRLGLEDFRFGSTGLMAKTLSDELSTMIPRSGSSSFRCYFRLICFSSFSSDYSYRCSRLRMPMHLACLPPI